MKDKLVRYGNSRILHSITIRMMRFLITIIVVTVLSIPVLIFLSK